MSILRRAGVATVAAGCATVATAPVLLGAPADAASGACPSGSGVTVVVDYGPLGGGVRTACDEDGGGQAATAVMAATGFDLDYVQTQPGFVCRIEGRPAPSQDDCVRTPPDDAYWGLFSSDGTSGKWTYSSTGVGGLDVPDGGSIGWRFQDGGSREDPGADPNGASGGAGSGGSAPHPTRSPQPTPSPQPTRSAQPTTSPPQPSSPPPTASTSAPPSAQAPEPTGEQSSSSTSGRSAERRAADRPHAERIKDKAQRRPSGSPRPAGASATPSARAEGAAVVSSDEAAGSDGNGVALSVAAGAAVVLLAGAVGVLAWRRRL